MKLKKPGLIRRLVMLSIIEMGNCGGIVLRSCRLPFLGDGQLILSDFRNMIVRSLTTGPKELKQLWYEHFSQVLNVTSQCNQELLDEMPSWELMQSLDDPPTSDELVVQ